jgi:hypothetical protein
MERLSNPTELTGLLTSALQGSVQVRSPHQLYGSHVQAFWQEQCRVSIIDKYFMEWT